MRRAFVVEAIALAGPADAVDAGRELGETAARSRLRLVPIRIIGGRDRILREGVQNVGEDQFLMLLLVVQADLQDAQHLGEVRLVGTCQQTLHRLVDMVPIGGHLGAVRPGQKAAQRARMTGTGRHVVGIEQVAEGGVEDVIAGKLRHQQKLLEEPSRVRPVPLGGTGIGHRLHDLILGAERRRAPFGLGAHRPKGVAPSASRGSFDPGARPIGLGLRHDARRRGDEGRMTKSLAASPIPGLEELTICSGQENEKQPAQPNGSSI